MEQIEAAETAENMDEDTATTLEPVLAAWPTPNTPNGGRSSPSMSATGVMPDGTKRQAGLEHVARLAGWPTPMAGSKATEDYNEAGNTDSSRRTVELCGWQTPKASDGAPPRDPEKRLKTDRQTRTPGMPGNYKLDLSDQVALVGWATPRAEDAESAGMRHSRGVADTLTAQAGQGMPLAGWSTPDTVPDAPCMGSNATKTTQGLGNQARGVISTSSPAATEKRGVLNPNMSRWLMGLPLSWTLCGMLAFLKTRSNRRSAHSRSSSTGSGA
jgi:hypothetical protein